MLSIQEENFSSTGAKFFRNSIRWSRIAFIFSVIVLLGGFLFLEHIAYKVDRADFNELGTKVQTIAHLTNAEDVANLTGTQNDLSSDSYTRIKKFLYDMHDINSNTRFVYLMRINNTKDKLVFLADSENPQSPDYSPPGQVYQDTSELELTNYINAIAFTEGPYTDSWGDWVSGYAPIWYQGKLVGVLGMDITASKGQEQDNTFQISIALMSVFSSLCFVFIGLYIQRTAKYLKH